jgi:hypothetical protein
MSNKIDLNSPIIPGRGAAGLVLGTLLGDIESVDLTGLNHHSIKAGLLNQSIFWETYTSCDLYLRFKEGKLDMIGVMGAYRGLTQQGLGIGSRVSDIELVYGSLIEGPDDILTFERVVDSLWFDVDCTDLNSSNWHSQVRLRKVKVLYVY